MHPARVAAAVLVLFAGSLACLQVVGLLDFLFQREARELGGTSATVALLALGVLSAAALGAAAWFLGRFVAGDRPRWLLSAGLVVAGICSTFISWVVWLGNFSGG